MLDRIVVDIVHMSFEVFFIANHMIQESSLPNMEWGMNFM